MLIASRETKDPPEVNFYSEVERRAKRDSYLLKDNLTAEEEAKLLLCLTMHYA
jgi:hypothetical protein